MTEQKCPYCSNDLHPGAAACSECGALVSPIPSETEAPSAEGAQPPEVGVSQDVPWAGGQQQQQPEISAPQQPWTGGQPEPPATGIAPQQPAAADTALPPEPAKAESFDEYVKQNVEREPITLGKIWSGFGAVVASVLVAMGAYAYFFGFSQCGNCSSQSPDPIGLNEVENGQITSFTDHKIYRLQLFDPANVNIAANGDFDTYLEVYAGESDTPMATDDDSGPGLNSQLSLRLQPGVYYILVRPYSSGTGNFVLSLTSL